MFDPVSFTNDAINKVKSNVKGRAIIASSGGIDSSVAAKLVSDALGKESLSVYIDTGLMRENETKEVERTFERLGINYKIIEAGNLFIEKLKGITDPELKRKIIGKTFIEVFEQEAKTFGAEYLIQGTIAPDWIESGGGLRDTIKSHHNVGGLPTNLNLIIYEPLRDLYKDEVRRVADHLGIPSNRQPFPGPGLAVRIIGEVTKEKLEILRKATSIIENHIPRLDVQAWQYFGILLSDKSTGVHGDLRVYGYTLAIRSVNSIDGMTANFSNIPLDSLGVISREITNTIPKINRVVYDITDKPPATIEWE